MAASQTVNLVWGDVDLPAGTPTSTGAQVVLHRADDAVQDLQNVPLETASTVFVVPAGTGWYFTIQTMAGPEPVGPEQRPPAFDVIDAPVRMRIVTGAGLGPSEPVRRMRLVTDAFLGDTVPRHRT